MVKTLFFSIPRPHFGNDSVTLRFESKIELNKLTPVFMQYTKDQRELIAIISHLATSAFKSGTLKGISDRTGLEISIVERLLTQYKEFFVKVPFKSNSKEDITPYYTLHLRYGLRRKDDDTDQGPLPEGYTGLLITLIQEGVNQENQTMIYKSQSKITMIAAIIAACAAILSAII